MHYIDHPTADTTDPNKPQFTEGNPATNIPATVVTADLLNDVMNNVAYVIQNLGLTLTKGRQQDLYDALLEISKAGGSPSALNETIANNQTAWTDFANFPTFDRTKIKAMEFLFSIERSTDDSSVIETGRAYVTYNSDSASWKASVISAHDSGGVSIQAVVDDALESDDIFKLQYKSTNLAGANYSGNMKITDITEVRL